MGSQSGMIQRFVPNLETLAHAVLSGRSKPALRFSVHTSKVVWLRAFGMTRVFDVDIGWQWSWFSHTFCEMRHLYIGSFVQNSSVGAYAHRQLYRSSSEVLMTAIADLWFPVFDDSNSSSDQPCELVVIDIVACSFQSIHDILDALLAPKGKIKINIHRDQHELDAITSGLFHLYDDPNQTHRIAWIGDIELEGQKRHACAYLDYEAHGYLHIFRS